MGINRSSMKIDWELFDKIVKEAKDEDVEIKSMTDAEIYEKIKDGGYMYNIRGGIEALKKFEEDINKNE